jgi:hypothetical protein
MTLPEHHVWVFNGQGGRFPGGVFTDRSNAESWIAANRLTGVLTAYPLDEGCFDWALRNGVANMRPETLERRRGDPLFVGSFSSAAQEHFHYEAGKRVSG